MLGIVSKGIIIGVLVSAPMGPIGMLCIQRTLNKGRWHGFVTGLGAALSDVIYAALTCLGMGVVVNFVEANQAPLQLIGSRNTEKKNYRSPKTLLQLFYLPLATC